MRSGPGRARTCDPQYVELVLFLLSYGALVEKVGFEPTSYCVQNSRSAIGATPPWRRSPMVPGRSDETMYSSTSFCRASSAAIAGVLSWLTIRLMSWDMGHISVSCSQPASPLGEPSGGLLEIAPRLASEVQAAFASLR